MFCKDSKTTKQKYVTIIIGLIAIVLLLIILTSVKGYEKTLDNYFKAHEKNDPNLLYSKVYADYWIDFTNEAWGEGHALERMEDTIENNLDNWGCGNKIKISYEITDKVKASKKEVDELEEYIQDAYVDYVYGNSDKLSITDAYLLKVNFVVKGDGTSKELYYPDGLLLIKENGKWKMTRGYISCSFIDNNN